MPPEVQPRARAAQVAEHEVAWPVLGMLQHLLAERWDGTLLVHDARDQPIAALRLDAGCVVAARIEAASGNLFQQVAELCALDDARFTLVDRSDLVRGPGVVSGRVDPARLAALREQARHASAPPRRLVSGSVAVDGGDDAIKRLRCADPNASRSVQAVRYHVQNPEHGVTRSQPPRRMSSTPSRAEADEYFLVAEKLLARGDCRSAVLEAQKGMQLGTPRPAQRALYAWLLHRSNESPEVQPHVWDHLQGAFDADPSCARAFYYKGLLLARTGRRAEALTHLERACQLAPNDAQAGHALTALRRAIALALSRGGEFL